MKQKLTQIEAAAAACGLRVATWAPGDGARRYRFFEAARKRRVGGTFGVTHRVYADYHEGGEIYTALGRGEALTFLSGRCGVRISPSRRVFRPSHIGQR